MHDGRRSVADATTLRSFSFSAAEEDRLRVKTQFFHLQRMRDVSNGGEIFMLYFYTCMYCGPIFSASLGISEYVFRGWRTGELTTICSSCYQLVITVMLFLFIR